MMEPTEKIESKSNADVGKYHDFAKETFLATNGKADLYQTSWTNTLTRTLNSRENYGYFENVMVVDIRDTKTKENVGYAVMSRDYKKIYFDFTDAWSFEMKLNICKMRMDEERDILNIGQKILDTKKEK